MSDTDDPSESSGDDDGSDVDGGVEELRAAAGEVVSSLQHFLTAAERLVEDRVAFGHFIEGGREAVTGFVEGFVEQVSDPFADGDSPTDEDDEPSTNPG